MGRYTQHWADYQRATNRRTLRLLGVLLLLPVIALVGYGLSGFGWGLYVLLALLAAWLVLFTRLALRATPVTCPQCAATYTRGKYLVNCPQCGLRMFQEDPNQAGAGG